MELNTPYGGELVNLVAEGREREALLAEANTLPSLQLPDRSVHDLELLATGAFSPLRSFMGKADYEGVLKDMRLANGTLWPLPVTLPVADDAPVQAGASVALRNSKNELLAVMRVAEVYPWNFEREATVMAGKPDPRHPLVAEMAGWGKRYAAGPLHVVNLPGTMTSRSCG